MKTILRRGFELLETRPTTDELKISNLESSYDVKLPPIFKNFVKLFYLKFKNTCDIVMDDNQRISDIEYFHPNNITGDRVFIDQLLPIEFCLSIYYENEFWEEKGYMQIGSGPSEGGILLCLKGDDMDSIIFNDGHKYTKLSDNIFDFIRDVVVLKKNEADLENNLKFDHLYKNWGEEFWRIKK